jgi:hypothetical protein
MSSLVNRKFAAWTEGLDPLESRISIFGHIRDIPYSLAVPHTDPVTAMDQLLVLGRGSCGPKHYLLAEMYRRLRLDIVYATFAFSWNDPGLRYPPALRALAAHIPVTHHLACRVHIGGRWVLVDATWDPPLARGGFPVNEHWDGISDTKCAVRPLPSPVRTAFCRAPSNEPFRTGEEAALCPIDGEKDIRDAGERAPYHQEKRALRTPAGIDRALSFYQELDTWMESLRQPVD